MGAGLFSALGTKFYNANGEVFIPTGGTLSEITYFDNSATNKLLKDVSLIGLYDVTNPLYGKDGAAFVYAPQKGATKEDVITLDSGLKSLASLIKKTLNVDVTNIPGAGSAGGLGASIIAFGNGRLSQGIETIFELTNFKEHAKSADFIITGEGKLDSQSFSGKVISGICGATLNTATKIILIVGNSLVSLEDAQRFYPHIARIIETNSAKLPFSQVKKNAAPMYVAALEKLMSEL